jgi:hypothetical protein
MCPAIGSLIVLGRAVAHGTCSTEVKVLLAAPSTQAAVSALGFGRQAEGTVYFFDTDARDLLRQGLLIRIRQGSKNDLTVKWRPPPGAAPGEGSRLRAQFPCEVDRTLVADVESFAVGRQYKVAKIAERGTDIQNLLDESQKQLLAMTHVTVDWNRVKRVATIRSTQWSTSRSSYGKLVLEQWTWPAGNILELSAKRSDVQNESKAMDLEALAESKGVPVSADQQTKSATVLGTPVRR